MLALHHTDRVVVYNADMVDNWNHAPGDFVDGVPMPYNWHQHIVGLTQRLTVKDIL